MILTPRYYQCSHFHESLFRCVCVCVSVCVCVYGMYCVILKWDHIVLSVQQHFFI